MSGDDIDPNVDPDLDPDDSGEPDDGGEYTPPSKEEWEKVQRTLRKRKEEAAQARREAAQARDAAAGKGKADDDDAVAKAQEASDNRARRSAGITALVEAGLTKAAAKDALPLLKLDKLAVDADGDVDDDDLEDAVSALKAKFPGMFSKDGRVKAPKARTADGGGRDGGTKTATDRTTERIMKAAGLA
jgi:hypothetical protein